MNQEIARSNLLFLYLAVFVAIVGFGMVFPLLPFYAQSFGANATQIGLLAAVFSIGQFFASPIVGRISDRFGRKPVLGIALLGVSLSFLIFGLAKSLSWLFISRFLHGIFSSGAFPIASAYIGDSTPKQERVKYMGRLTAMLSLGFIVGPALSGFLSASNPTLPFFVASLVAFLSSLFIFLFLPESLREKAEKLIIKEGLVNVKAIIQGLRSEFGILFFLLFSWAFAIANFQVAFPLFSEERFNFGGSQTGFVFALVGIVSAIVQWVLLPRLVKIFQEFPTIALGVFIMSAGQFLIPFSSKVLFLTLFVLISGLGGSLLRPTANAVLSERTLEGQGTTMGLAFSFESLGRMTGPLLAGVLISLFGTQSQFVLTALLLIFGLPFLFKKNSTINKK